METKITYNKIDGNIDATQPTKEAIQFFYPTSSPYVTVVTYTNGEKFHGYFENFMDKDELLKKGQVRFIPNNNAIAFRESKTENGQRDYLKYSVIIDLTKTKHIMLINPSNRHIKEEVEFV